MLICFLFFGIFQVGPVQTPCKTRKVELTWQRQKNSITQIGNRKRRKVGLLDGVK